MPAIYYFILTGALHRRAVGVSFLWIIDFLAFFFALPEYQKRVFGVHKNEQNTLEKLSQKIDTPQHIVFLPKNSKNE